MKKKQLADDRWPEFCGVLNALSCLISSVVGFFCWGTFLLFFFRFRTGRKTRGTFTPILFSMKIWVSPKRGEIPKAESPESDISGHRRSLWNRKVRCKNLLPKFKHHPYGFHGHGIFLPIHEWLILMINVGKYTIPRWYGSFFLDLIPPKKDLFWRVMRSTYNFFADEKKIPKTAPNI